MITKTASIFGIDPGDRLERLKEAQGIRAKRKILFNTYKTKAQEPKTTKLEAEGTGAAIGGALGSGAALALRVPSLASRGIILGRKYSNYKLRDEKSDNRKARVVLSNRDNESRPYIRKYIRQVEKGKVT